MEETRATNGAGDFDFLIGEWSVRHRRLEHRLAGNTNWVEFSGPASARKILGGLGNVDEITVNLPTAPYLGATLRLFNPVTRQWSIHWMDSRSPGLDAPMTGQFNGNCGLFYGDDTFTGRPIKVRFIWSVVSLNTCRWEQAFSADGGASWETNWTMDFTRIGKPEEGIQMNVPTTVHETFVLETTIDAAPSLVFGAYADVRMREEWAAPGSDTIVYDKADFRVGSGDTFRCGPTNDLKFHGAVVYHEIVQDKRFVFVESIRVGDQTLSLGMVTWELLPEGDGTRLRATTQMVSFVGPHMVAGSKSGTQAALNNLAAWLSRAPSRP